jgi:hypothetical protein
VWPPVGFNLTWTVTAPGIAFLFSPLTLLLGPLTAYDIAGILLPAGAAWAAFLLCQRLTRRFWAAFAGGYLYGFSSYMLAHQAQLNLASVLLIPLVALQVWRYLDDELSRRGFIVRLGPLLALQLLFSTEIAFTLTLALVGALLLAFVVVPARRRQIVSLAWPVTASYLIAGILTAPFLYFLFTQVHTGYFNPPEGYSTDLLGALVPTKLELLGQGWLGRISSHFPGKFENSAFAGPALAIVGLFGWRSWRTDGGRFLLTAFGVTGLASLGSRFTVDGHGVFWLPWALVVHLPIWDNVLPARLSLYVWLVTAVIVSLWIASTRGGLLRWLLPVLAVLALAPNLSAPYWATTYRVPAFFTSSGFRACLSPGEIILAEPAGSGGDSMLWQAAADFRFQVDGGTIQTPPSAFMHPQSIELVSRGEPIPPEQYELLRAFIRAKHVTSVVADPRTARAWIPALDRLARPQAVGGILLYRVAANAPPCAKGA